MSNERTTLYRFYDASGRLLYVGIAGNPGRRFDNHSKDKQWWGDVVGSTMEHFDTRAAAAAAEIAAITDERPAHNVAHNSRGSFYAWVRSQHKRDDRIADLADAVRREAGMTPRHGTIDDYRDFIETCLPWEADHLLEALYDAWSVWLIGDRTPTIGTSGDFVGPGHLRTPWWSHQLSILTTIYVDPPSFCSINPDDQAVLDAHNKRAIEALFAADYHGSIIHGGNTIVSLTEDAPEALETIRAMVARGVATKGT